MVILLAASGRISAQEYYSTRSIVVEDLLEKIARDSEEELDYHTLLQNMYAYLESPLNINTASREELEKLHLLTDFQVASLQQYISENGPLLTIYELTLVYGFNETIARSIEPLVTFGIPDRTSEPGRLKSTHQLITRISSVLEEQKGYSDATDSALAANPNSRYNGNRLGMMVKYRYKLGDKLMVGYNGDKDAGETFFSGENRAGFDFNSVYMRVNDTWKFKSILLGDYQVKAGQGLSVWSGLAFGKSPDIINIRKRGSVLKHYNSVDENRFMRGAAATIELGDVDITAFYSRKSIDANLVEDSLGNSSFFSSFQSTGYHRIPREIEDKNALRETVTGGVLNWDLDRLNLGASFIHYIYGADYLNDKSTSLPKLEGRSNSNFGLHYSAGFQKLSLFGEASCSVNSPENFGNKPFAILNGASFELHPRVSMSLLQRYMGAGYIALYGNAFRENSVNTNENGIYLGIEVLPIPRWKLSAYLDAYRFPFLAELMANSHSGYDYHIQAEYTDRDRLSGYLRFRYKTKPGSANFPSDPGTPGIMPSSSQLRFHISYPLSDALTFQDRLELSFFKQENRESGWLAYHDVIWKPKNLPLGFSFRYAMFDTESYASRIYTYEHDVLYSFSIPSWYDRGIRTYLNARWQIGRHIDLWLKYALSWYPDRETISSGLNEIRGHHRSDIRLQLRMQLQ